MCSFSAQGSMGINPWLYTTTNLPILAGSQQNTPSCHLHLGGASHREEVAAKLKIGVSCKELRISVSPTQTPGYGRQKQGRGCQQGMDRAAVAQTKTGIIFWIPCVLRNL